MVIDSLHNAARYYGLHPSFRQAFEYINTINIAAAQDGTSIIGEGLKAIVSNAPGKAKEQSLQKFECHDKHIDIQVCISGRETIGWKPREQCRNANGEYNTDKDVRFYKDAPDMYFELTDSQFAIFFPDDVHAPMIGDGAIKKLVIKVKI